MKRIWILILMMAALVVGAQDVRKLFWGMTQAEVIAVEGEDTLPIDENTLAYQRILLEQPARMICEFIAGKLMKVTYDIKNIYIYSRFRDGLVERYGKPTLDRPSYCSWFGPRTTIMLFDETTYILLIYGDTAADERIRKEEERLKKEQQKQDIGEL